MISLSPFLNISLIIENFNLSGKTPQDRDLLQIYVKVEIIKGALIFMILIGISSSPQEFSVFMDLMMFYISLVVAKNHWIFGNGRLNLPNKYFIG